MVHTGLPRLPFLPFLTRVFTLVSTRVLISEDTTPAQVLWEDFPTLMQRLDTSLCTSTASRTNLSPGQRLDHSGC